MLVHNFSCVWLWKIANRAAGKQNIKPLSACVCMEEFKKVIDTLSLYVPKKEIMMFSKKIRI